MNDFFSKMAKIEFLTTKFDEYQSLINKCYIEECHQCNNTNSLITNGFDVFTNFNKNLIDQDCHQNFVIMEIMKQISADIQGEF
jgi:hypothetical protein